MLAYANSVQKLTKLTVMMEDIANEFAELRRTCEQLGK